MLLLRVLSLKENPERGWIHSFLPTHMRASLPLIRQNVVTIFTVKHKWDFFNQIFNICHSHTILTV